MDITTMASVLLLAWMQAGGEAQKPPDTNAGGPREVVWQEGVAIPIRVPVSGPDREEITTVAFPETSIREVISGWGGEGATGASRAKILHTTARGGHLFLKLTRSAQGNLQVIGGSGRLYPLYIGAVKAPDHLPPGTLPRNRVPMDEAVPGTPPPSDLPVSTGPKGPDEFVRITLPPAARIKAPAEHRPKGANGTPAIWLMRAMRLGARIPGGRILRAQGEPALVTDHLSIHLAFVYDTPTHVGRIFDVRNRTDRRLAVDVTRLRMKPSPVETAVASALRENILTAGGTTRLYLVTWKRTQ